MRTYGVSRWEKLGRGGTDDELAKPLIAIQRVQVPPDQSRADRSVASVAIHRATGGCEACTARKSGHEGSAPKSYVVVMPTLLRWRKAVSGSDR